MKCPSNRSLQQKCKSWKAMNNLHTSKYFEQICHQCDERRKKKLFDFMSTLRGVPVVKMRQKTDHKHSQTILTLYSDTQMIDTLSLNLQTCHVRGRLRTEILFTGIKLAEGLGTTKRH